MEPCSFEGDGLHELGETACFERFWLHERVEPVYKEEVTMAKGRNRVVVVPDFPRSVPEFLLRMETVVGAMEANVGTFPAPSPPLVDVRSHMKELSDVQAAFETHKSPIAPRDAAFDVLWQDGMQLHAYVQSLATATPEQAAVIAGQAAMALQSRTKRHKPPLTVVQKLSASVVLVGTAIKHAGRYDWQLSLDGGLTWQDLPPTTQARTTVTNLEVGVVVLFRYRILTKDGMGDWSDPVSHLVT